MTMHILSTNRRGGKTTSAVAWATDKPERVLVVANDRQAEKAAEMLRLELVARGFRPGRARARASKQVVTADSAAKGALRGRSTRRGRQVEVAYDDIDLCLASMVGVAATYGTFSGTIHADTTTPWPPAATR